MLVPKPRIGSGDASARTLRERSRLIEKVITAISVPPVAMGSPEEERHVRAQLVHTVKRSRETYEAVVRKVGLDVQVRLGPDEMVELKAITGMPYSAQRVLRTFLQSKGMDVFSSEHKLRAAVKQLEVPCEVGQFTPEDEEQQSQSYARIPASQLWTTLGSLARARYRRGELVWWPNQPADKLFFLLVGDKGGSSTKLQLVWLNSREPQSSRSATLLGLVEESDTYEVVSAVFGPALRTLGTVPDSWCVTDVGDEAAAAVPVRPLSPNLRLDEKRPKNEGIGEWDYDVNNRYRSHLCKQCRVRDSTPPISPPKIDVRHVVIFYGGDVMWVHTLLGTQGPGATYFCTTCTARLDDLKWQSGKVHSPISTKAEVDGAAELRSAARTLQSLQQHSHHFTVDQASIAEGSDYQNCVRPPLIYSEINEFLAIPSLHIKQGLVGNIFKVRTCTHAPHAAASCRSLHHFHPDGWSVIRCSRPAALSWIQRLWRRDTVPA